MPFDFLGGLDATQALPFACPDRPAIVHAAGDKVNVVFDMLDDQPGAVRWELHQLEEKYRHFQPPDVAHVLPLGQP